MILCIRSSNTTLRSIQFWQRALLNPSALPQINPGRNCSCKLFDSTQNKHNHVVNNCRLSQRWGGCFPLKSTGETTQPWPASVLAAQHVCIPRSARPARAVVQQCTTPGPLMHLPTPPSLFPVSHIGPVCPSGQAAHRGNMSARAERKTRGPTRDSHGSAFTG